MPSFNLGASSRRSGKKRSQGPPPQPTLPAIRATIIAALERPPSTRCPHCRRPLSSKILPKSCFCNGPLSVKSLGMIISSLGSCFCPWSARRLPHYAIRSTSRQVNLGSVLRRSGHSTTHDLAKPASQRRDLIRCRPCACLHQSHISPHAATGLTLQRKLHPPTCGEERHRVCGQGRPSHASSRDAWPHRAPNVLDWKSASPASALCGRSRTMPFAP